MLAIDNLAEAADGIGELDIAALGSGELLGDEERLRKEALDLARPGYDQLASSESSSTPRIAMMSCSSLLRYRTRLTDWATS